MREIKFRAWDKEGRTFFDLTIPAGIEYLYHEVRFGSMEDTRYGWYLTHYGAVVSCSTFEKLEVIIYENPELLKGEKS